MFKGQGITGEAVTEMKVDKGWRFIPTDEELVINYLNKKILNSNFQYPMITDVEIYAYHPQKLIDVNRSKGESSWYFFDKILKTDRQSRNTQGGFWKASSKKCIMDSLGVELGLKRNFTFFEGTHSDKKKTEWQMLEYYSSASDKTPENSHSRKLVWVLCKLYKTGSSAIKKNGEAQQVNQEKNEQCTGHLMQEGSVETQVQSDSSDFFLIQEVLSKEGQSQDNLESVKNSGAETIGRGLLNSDDQKQGEQWSNTLMGGELKDGVKGLEPVTYCGDPCQGHCESLEEIEFSSLWSDDFPPFTEDDFLNLNEIADTLDNDGIRGGSNRELLLPSIHSDCSVSYCSCSIPANPPRFSSINEKEAASCGDGVGILTSETTSIGLQV